MLPSRDPLTEPQLAALAKLACGLEADPGIALLCGPAGVGKTTVLERLAAELGPAAGSPPVRDAAGWLAADAGLPEAVIVDDAHLAEPAELVRLLARCRTRRPPAAVVLAGEGRLLTLCARDPKLAQAVRIRVALLPGSLGETRQLLAGRPASPGGTGFDEHALVAIHEIAAGVPADVMRLAGLADVVAASRADGVLAVGDIEAIHRRLSPHAA